jgi:hypothetical protein
MNSTDIKKILTGALIAAAGAVITYAEIQAFPILKESAGIWAPLLTSVQSVVINAARKWLASYAKSEGIDNG